MRIGPAQVLPFATTAVDVTPYRGAAILHGWAVKETTNAAPASFNLCDGTGGPVIVPITLATNESTRDWLDGAGIIVRTGLYVDVLSGSVSGTLWFRPVDPDIDQLELDVHDWLDHVLHALRWSA